VKRDTHESTMFQFSGGYALTSDRPPSSDNPLTSVGSLIGAISARQGWPTVSC